MMLSAMLLAVLAAAHASALAGVDETTFTTYRVTPINYPGVTNMDSGNAAGDVMFGLEQLLLPQLCAVEPSFLWCDNRKYLSGGNATMVYSEFEIATRDAFGEYQACNPCSGQKPDTPPAHGGSNFNVYCPPGVKNGTFVCENYGGNTGPIPPQCDSGYRMWVQDCLNGTVYKTLDNLDPKSAEGSCCAACSSDPSNCKAWNMPAGYNGTVCQLMKDPLIMWDDGQSFSKCKAAVVDHDQYNCWYQNPYYNATFGKFCDRSLCHCDVLEKSEPVGRELMAMCHQYKSPSSVPQLTYTSMDFESFLSEAKADYWSCSRAVEEYCFDGYQPSRQCSECAQQHKSELSAAGCTQDFISHLCDASFESCERAVEENCHKSIGQQAECVACADTHVQQMEAANCTGTFVDYMCSGGGSHDNKWEEYIQKFSCLMNGTWYSTASAGQCTGKQLAPDCWWYIKQEKRTVNASCVDNNVVATVHAIRPKCWEDCPNGQGKNISSACFLDCLFETLLGNSTTGLKPMERDAIIAPFVKSFESSDPSNGGCPDVKVPPSTFGDGGNSAGFIPQINPSLLKH